MNRYKAIIVIWMIMISISCASYKTQYANSKRNVSFQKENIDFVLYLIGDAGNAHEGEKIPILNHLKSKLNKENNKSAIIWLGDNIYPYGLSPENNEEYSLLSYRLKTQLETMDNYNGLSFFIPGNHDWYKYGAEGIKRQETYIENYLDKRSISSSQEKTTYFVPNNACAEPVVISLTDELKLITGDSQWYIHGFKDQNSKNCQIKNRTQFLNAISDTINKYVDKTIILALHHPMYSFGAHGGRNTIKQHLFPLTNIKPYLYLPLPGIGSLIHYIRSHNSQSVNNSTNQKLKKTILNAFGDTGPHFIISGHDHSMQYIKRNKHHFVISGSASKSEPVGMGKGSQFASCEHAYAKIYFLVGGKRVIEFITTDLITKEEIILYSSYME